MSQEKYIDGLLEQIAQLKQDLARATGANASDELSQHFAREFVANCIATDGRRFAPALVPELAAALHRVIEAPLRAKIAEIQETANERWRQRQTAEQALDRAKAELRAYREAVDAQPWATDEPIRVLLDRVTAERDNWKVRAEEMDGYKADCMDLRRENEALKAEVEAFKANNRYHRGYAAGEESMKAENESLKQRNADLVAALQDIVQGRDGDKAHRAVAVARAALAFAKAAAPAQYAEGALDKMTATLGVAAAGGIALAQLADKAANLQAEQSAEVKAP